MGGATTKARPVTTPDAGRSREAVLDAAERLFAEEGCDAASLAAIGDAAGLLRATPSSLRARRGRDIVDDLLHVVAAPAKDAA